MRNKYIAPIVITIITVIYALGMLVFLFGVMGEEPLPIFVSALLLAGPVLGAALVVAALLQRIREIKGGEEDAASKY